MCSARSSESFRTRKTALVVDDVDDMLDLLEIALTSAEFDVLRASSTSEAREVFQRSDQVDLLMTDLRVGGDNGLELAHQLLAAKPSLRVLAMSGFFPERRLGGSKNQIEFLPKPFSTSELKAKLRSVFAPAPAASAAGAAR
jgi:DNA-binding NtrC family response regulator